MADPTTVNPQITDAVRAGDADAEPSAAAGILSDAPSVAIGTLYQASAQSLALAMQNAVAAQQQMNTIAQAATSTAVSMLNHMGPSEGLSLDDLLGMPYMPMSPDEENN